MGCGQRDKVSAFDVSLLKILEGKILGGHGRVLLKSASGGGCSSNDN